MVKLLWKYQWSRDRAEDLWLSGCEKTETSASTATSKCASLRSAVKASAISGSESGSGKPNCAQLEKHRSACSDTADDGAAVLRYRCNSGTTAAHWQCTHEQQRQHLFADHFLGQPGKFWILLELGMTEVVVTTGTIRRAKLQTNTAFYRPDAIHVTQPTVSEHWRGKVKQRICSHKLTWGLPSWSWPVKAPGYLGGWLRSLSSADWCQHPTDNYTYLA